MVCRWTIASPSARRRDRGKPGRRPYGDGTPPGPPPVPETGPGRAQPGAAARVRRLTGALAARRPRRTTRRLHAPAEGRGRRRGRPSEAGDDGDTRDRPEGGERCAGLVQAELAG